MYSFAKDVITKQKRLHDKNCSNLHSHISEEAVCSRSKWWQLWSLGYSSMLAEDITSFCGLT